MKCNAYRRSQSDIPKSLPKFLQPFSSLGAVCVLLWAFCRFIFYFLTDLERSSTMWPHSDMFACLKSKHSAIETIFVYVDLCVRVRLRSVILILLCFVIFGYCNTWWQQQQNTLHSDYIIKSSKSACLYWIEHTLTHSLHR